MNADDLRPCKACGEPCDGSVCDEVCAQQLDVEGMEESDEESGEDEEDEDREPKPDYDYTPFEETSTYRDQMIDAGRGHLVRY